MNWILRTLQDAGGNPSSRRVLFAMAVSWALGLCCGLLAKGHPEQAVKLAESTVWATAGAVAVGKFAEAK